MRARHRLRQCEGFTLLEVLIAISIMIIGIGTILVIESNSMQATDKARQWTVASMLAKRAMTQMEMIFEGKAFNDVKDSESGQFEAPFEKFQWTRTVKELEFPNIGANAKDNAPKEQQDGAMVDQMGQMITQFLSKGIREVTVTVRWPRGKGFQEVSVTQYWVDLNHELQITP